MTAHEYYGVPVWLMKEYLADLGGVAVAENVVAGEGWRAVIAQATPRRIGSLVVGGRRSNFLGMRRCWRPCSSSFTGRRYVAAGEE